MYNKVVLVGNLTRDIEIRHTQTGTAIANTAIATSKKFKGQNGEQKEEVMFIDISFFGRTAEVAQQYLRRGSKVLVEGRVKFDQWTDQNGGKRSKHSISVETMQMLDSKDASTSHDSQPSMVNTNQHATHNNQETQAQAQIVEPNPFNEEDIPF